MTGPRSDVAGARRESPSMVAARLGLGYRAGHSGGHLSLDELLDRAVSEYWRQRNEVRGAA